MANQQVGYQQGDLDCFCGFYTLINLVNQLRGPFTYEESSSLFESLVSVYESNWPLKASFVEGINGMQMSKLLNVRVIEPFNLVSTKPFHSRPYASKQLVLNCIRKWTEKNGLIVWGNETHWTLIIGVRNRNLILLDSAGREYLSSQLIHHQAKGDYQLCPQHLYFLKRKEDAL